MYNYHINILKILSIAKVLKSRHSITNNKYILTNKNTKYSIIETHLPYPPC